MSFCKQRQELLLVNQQQVSGYRTNQACRAQRPRAQVSRQHPVPHQVEQHRQHCQAVPGAGRALHQGSRNGERLPQRIRRPGRPGAPRMPVARQPPHVRRQHRIDHPHPAELPARRLAGQCRHRERLRIAPLDPVIGADVDHHARPVAQPGKEIRGMPTAAAAVVPVQPERLRADSRYRRI
jgi:hypothetical protein